MIHLYNALITIREKGAEMNEIKCDEVKEESLGKNWVNVLRRQESNLLIGNL